MYLLYPLTQACLNGARDDNKELLLSSADLPSDKQNPGGTSFCNVCARWLCERKRNR